MAGNHVRRRLRRGNPADDIRRLLRKMCQSENDPSELIYIAKSARILIYIGSFSEDTISQVVIIF